MLKSLQREAIRTFVLGKDVLYPFPRVMVNPSSLTRVRPLAQLLGDFISIVHFSPLTVGTSPKFLCARATIRVLSVSFYMLQRAHCTLFHSVTR